MLLQSLIDLKDNFQNYYNIAMQGINELPDDSFFKSEPILEFSLVTDAPS